jgi:hypothetical protein
MSHSHTVEEVQDFSNTYTPSPPWVHVVRLLVPMSCCDKAAAYLIAALGGPDVARRTVGGIKWWQVRGINGYVPAIVRFSAISNFGQRRCSVDRRQEGLAGSEEAVQRIRETEDGRQIEGYPCKPSSR